MSKKRLNDELGIKLRFYIPSSLMAKISGTPSKKLGLNAKGKTFAFMGDSYTATPVHGWQSIMSTNYGLKEQNLARGGKQTKWMLEATKKYFEKARPNYFVIYGGANDAYSGVTKERVFKNVQDMVDIARANGAIPIVVLGYNARKVQVGNTRQKPNSWQLKNGITQQKLWGMGENYYQMQLEMQKIKNAIIVPIWEEGTKTDVYDGLHMGWAANKKFGLYVGDYLFGTN